MLRLAPMVLSVIAITHIGHSETWISHNSQVFRLKKTTVCNKVADHNQQAYCDCCLVKQTHIHEKSSIDAIRHCVSEHKCTFEAESLNDINVAGLTLEKAQKNLRAMSIVNIEKMINAPKLPSDGILYESHIMDILKSLAAEGYLDLPINFDEKIVIKPLSDAAKGFWSGQLFSIRYQDNSLDKSSPTKPLYILKETKKGLKEIDNLYHVAASPLSAEKVSTRELLQHPIKDSTMARISFDDLHFKLKSKGVTRYFSLLQTAPGKSLHSYLKEFGKISSSHDINDVGLQTSYLKMKHIFYRIGFAVSRLHQKYAVTNDNRIGVSKRTFVHGDMHSENIFFDDASDIVTMIDNETFALSTSRPISGVNDLVEFYIVHTIHTVAQKFSDQLTINTEFGIDDRIWHELCRSLFNGYLSAYKNVSKDEYISLYHEFRKRFFEGFSQGHILSSPRNLTDQRQLKRLGFSARRRHIEHVELAHTFDRLYIEGINKYQ